MSPPALLLFTVVLTLLLPFGSVQDCGARRHSYFWTVRDAHSNVTSHLFGYLRVSANLVWDTVPALVKAEFRAADVAVFELNGGGTTALKECIKKQWQHEQLHGTAMPRELALRLERFLFRLPPAFAKLPFADNWRTLPTKWLLYSLLHVQASREMALLSGASEGQPIVNEKMLKEASEHGKPLKFLEGLEEHCHGSKPPPELLYAGIAHLLDELDRMGECAACTGPNEQAIERYKCGLFEREDALLGRHGSEPLRKLNELLLDDIVVAHSWRWVDRAARMMREQPNATFFFTVSASHLVGDQNLAQLLANQGFVVQEVDSELKRAIVLPTDVAAAELVTRQSGSPPATLEKTLSLKVDLAFLLFCSLILLAAMFLVGVIVLLVSLFQILAKCLCCRKWRAIWRVRAANKRNAVVDEPPTFSTYMEAPTVEPFLGGRAWKGRQSLNAKLDERWRTRNQQQQQNNWRGSVAFVPSTEEPWL